MAELKPVDLETAPIVEQELPTVPEDNLVIDQTAGLPTGPSTEEAQVATESAKNFADEVQKFKARSKTMGKFRKEPSDLEAKLGVLKERQESDEKAQKEAQVADARRVGIKEKRFESINNEINELQGGINTAQAQGIPVEDLEARLHALTAEKQQMIDEFNIDAPTNQAEAELESEAQKAPGAPATRTDVNNLASASEPNKAEVDQLAEQEKAANTARQVIQQANLDKIAKEQEILQSSLKELRDENANLEKEPARDFWENKSTWQKVLAGIGMIMGGAPAVNIVMKAIDQDLAAQKLSKDKELARRQQALKLVEAQIGLLSKRTDNEFKRQKLGILQGELQIKKDEAQRERLKLKQDGKRKADLAAQLTNRQGMSREEIEKLNINNPKMKIGDRALYIVDTRTGEEKGYIASGLDSAKKAKETLKTLKPSITGIKRLIEIAKDEPFGGRFGLFSSRPESKTLVQSIIGGLRIELFGPGVMTDTEQALARKIIGASAEGSIFKLTDVEKTKLETMLNKLQFSLRDKLTIDGVALPKSKNDQAIRQMQEFHKGQATAAKKAGRKYKIPNKAEVINGLIKRGVWDETDGGLF